MTITPDTFKALREKSDKLFKDNNFIPNYVSNRTVYDEKVESLRKILREKHISKDEYRYAMACLIAQCKKVLFETGFSATLPKMPVKFVELKTFRTEKWLQKSSQIKIWYESFLSQIRNVKSSVLKTEDEWLGLIMFSAMVFGGLLDKKYLQVLYYHLITQEKPLCSVNNQTYIILDNHIEKGDFSIRIDGRPVKRKIWWPDTITLGLIIHFLKLRSATSKQVKVSSHQVIYDQIRNTLFNSCEHGTDINSLHHVIGGAVYANLAYLRADLSEVLINIAMGNNASLSIDEQSLLNLNAIKSSKIVAGNLTLAPEKTAIDKDQSEVNDFPSIKPLYEDLIAVLKRPSHTSKQKISTEFIKIKEDYKFLPKSILLFIDWIAEGAKTLARSSLRTYFHSISKIWLPEALFIDLETATASDLLCFYERVLDRVQGMDTKAFKAARIKNIHDYGVKSSQYKLHKINDMGILDELTGGVVSRVRTQIVNHRHMKMVVQLMLSKKGSCINMQSMCLITILAYRLAGRLGELLKIRVKDIELGGNGQLSIVNNAYGRNKSRSSNRRIPLKPLLHKDEYQAFVAFYLKRHQVAASNHLLFGFGGANIRFDNSYVSQTVIQILRRASGQDTMVFHNLRHSGANVMFAIFEREFELAGHISGFNKKKLKEIRQAIIGNQDSSLASYWELAQFMGHSGPLETMHSYLHISDMLIHNKMQRVKLPLSLTAISGITGMPISKIQIKNRGKIQIDNRDKINAFMAKKNSRFYQTSFKSRPSSHQVEYSFPDLKDCLETDYRTNFHLARVVLEKHQAGSSVSEVCKSYQYSEKHFLEILVRAKKVFSATTNKGNKRVNAAEPIEGIPEEKQVTPKLPHFDVCKREAATVLTHLLKLEDLVSVQQWARVVFQALQQSPMLTIQNPVDLAVLINRLKGIMPLSRWKVQIYLDNVNKDNPKKALWLMDLPDSIKIKFVEKNTEDKGDGYAHVHLLHKNSKQIVKENNKRKTKVKYDQFTSDQLKYISQMLLIMLPEGRGERATSGNLVQF